MCGIAGILRITPSEHVREAMARTPGESIPEAWLDVLDAAIAHRGPDGCGRFRDRAVRADGSVVDVALVHRRLSVIDPAGGAQPMVSRGENDGEGTVAVVFNGCIYNHRELRAELERLGRRFATDHSDTEVLVHGWREWGDELWEKLDGMFAVGLWDAKLARLTVARDVFGEKPLYYNYWLDSDGSHFWLFANTAAALMRLSARLLHKQHVVNSDSLSMWLRFGCSLGFPGAIEPWPGEVEQMGELRYSSWVKSFDFIEQGKIDCKTRDRSLSSAHVTRLLENAIASRLETDVPLGCFLSGGVDSSVIAAIAKKQLGSLKTFTVRMPDARYDESEYAEAVARAIGTEHHTLDCEENPAEDLKLLIEQLGLPFGDSSLLPTYWLSKAVRRHATVALSGDGGDELFVGYERYKAAAYLEKYGLALRMIPDGLLSGRNPRSRSAKLKRLAEAARHGRYAELISIFPTPMLKRLMPNSVRHHLAVQGLENAVWSDVTSYLPFDLLRKTDTASMAVGLEVRSPMLHLPLVEACLRAPISDLMPGGRLKGLLKDVAARHIPRELIDRPKMGFAIPIGEWFRSDYGGLRTMLLDHLSAAEPFGPDSLGINAMIDMGYVRRLIDEHGVPTSAAAARGTTVKRDHSQRLYMLLVLSIWAKWLGGLPRVH